MVLYLHALLLSLSTTLTLAPEAVGSAGQSGSQAAQTAPKPAVTVPAMPEEDVLLFMSKVPDVEVCPKGRPERAGRWEKRPHAKLVAKAISLAAQTREEAGRMSIYAIFESNLNPYAVGDGGHSLGIWQLQGVLPASAFDPLQAAPIWLARSRENADLCLKQGNAPDEALAALASGSCSRGRALVRRREELLRRILQEIDEVDGKE